MNARGVTPQEFCDSILTKIDQFQAVCISDKEGVEIVSAIAPELKGKVQFQNFSLVITAVNSIRKLQMGSCNSILGSFENCLFLAVPYENVVATIVGLENTDRDLMLSIVPQIKAALESIYSSISNIVNE